MPEEVAAEVVAADAADAANAGEPVVAGPVDRPPVESPDASASRERGRDRERGHRASRRDRDPPQRHIRVVRAP